MSEDALEKNQTLPEWLEKRSSGDLGTALYGTVTFENGFPEPLVQAIADIDYEKALEFSTHARAFKWVPHSVIRTDDVHILCATQGLRCHHIATCGAGCMCYGIGMVYTCTRPRAIYRLSNPISG
ncbi:hypothetical protein [Agrobacterium sp. B1(2019)]|uniref:hypothetical protein n=1 Tax=Agrobacterium sp. B1(2019) TaxID=2607032 RepID=UPI0011EED426|nr:hypothetical protein [Agrobacterium sp. B1(2019)]TZG34276.1 hypothetical protein AGR1_16340 [Agrobacterium sp. B1(2019)]